MLQQQLSEVYANLSPSLEDLPGYAGKVFELTMANPQLTRLMAWAALEQEGSASTQRAASRDEKLDALQQAQKRGDIGNAFPPNFLLTAILAMASAWSAASPFGPGLDPKAAKDVKALRRNVERATRLLVENSAD